MSKGAQIERQSGSGKVLVHDSYSGENLHCTMVQLQQEEHFLDFEKLFELRRWKELRWIHARHSKIN
jgi:hypothetical protein